MLRLARTTSNDPSFRSLVQLLDEELWAQYEDEMKNYAPHNKIEDNKNVVVAYVDDTAVGCGCFKRFDEASVEIKRMYVRKNYRGQKIAESILKELEQWARESEYSSSVLETGTKQVEALRLYQRYGYNRIENYGPYIGLPSSICFRKSL